MSDPTVVVQTRSALQSVAEHVLSAALHQATGRIGLRAAPGGFATPRFPSEHGPRTLAVSGLDLVVADDRGARSAPLTTVGDAAALAEIEPGAPTSVYQPTTPLSPDAALAVDGGAARLLADWWSLVDEALAAFRSEHAADAPTDTQLWPEHFDIGAQVGEVNYGGSPGDPGDELPYLYVGPWSPPEPDGTFWNRPFGALVPASEVPDADAALAFFRAGRDRLA